MPPTSASVIEQNSARVPQQLTPFFFDTRTSLQDTQVAWCHSGPSGQLSTTVDGLGFTTNVDGSGTHAFVVTWPSAYRSRCTTVTRSLPMRFASLRPSEMYLQWKQHMGRTATGGGVGRIGSFTVANAACANSGRTDVISRLLRTASQSA